MLLGERPMRIFCFIRRIAVFAAAVLLAVAGCDAPPPGAPPAGSPPVEVKAPGPPAQPQSARQRQAAFLNRIREADPNGRTIDRAFLNAQNELGLVLDHSVEMDKIPALMRLMLTKMAAEFPGEDLTVLAYTPSDPPHKIGTARLNAGTRDMTYTPEK